MLDIILLITHATILFVIYLLVSKQADSIRAIKKETDNELTLLENNFLHTSTRFQDIIGRFNELERHVYSRDASNAKILLETVNKIAKQDDKTEMNKKNIAMLWRKFQQIKKFTKH